MSTIPALTGVKLEKILKKSGFIKDRQKGSHLILIHPINKSRVVIPIHAGKTIKKSLLMAIIKDAKLSVEEFMDLL